jgi:Carbohydrate-selective porin, OprB family
VGVLHNNNSFPALNNPLVRSDGYVGVYLMAQQTAYRPGGPGTTQGATVWGAWTCSSKDLVSGIPLFCSIGASYVGLIAARHNDVVSLAVMRTEGSTNGPPSTRPVEMPWFWCSVSAHTLMR